MRRASAGDWPRPACPLPRSRRRCLTGSVCPVGRKPHGRPRAGRDSLKPNRADSRVGRAPNIRIGGRRTLAGAMRSVGRHYAGRDPQAFDDGGKSWSLSKLELLRKRRSPFLFRRRAVVPQVAGAARNIFESSLPSLMLLRPASGPFGSSSVSGNTSNGPAGAAEAECIFQLYKPSPWNDGSSVKRNTAERATVGRIYTRHSWILEQLDVFRGWATRWGGDGVGPNNEPSFSPALSIR